VNVTTGRHLNAVPDLPGDYPVTIKAPGRPKRQHPTSPAFDLRKAMDWLMWLRKLQAEGMDYPDALAQADLAFGYHPN
jgi:hypothetical protein